MWPVKLALAVEFSTRSTKWTLINHRFASWSSSDSAGCNMSHKLQISFGDWKSINWRLTEWHWEELEFELNLQSHIFSLLLRPETQKRLFLQLEYWHSKRSVFFTCLKIFRMANILTDVELDICWSLMLAHLFSFRCLKF